MSTFTVTPDTVRRVQLLLAALGHDPVGDDRGVLGERTGFALQAFQRERGLPITGALDVETWNRLLEAGWGLGDRLLYASNPLLRGDDVADLQEALALLGFNPGRIDGIFGSLTDHAVSDFQRNCGLPTTGVLDRATLNQLVRLSSRSTSRRPVTEARDATALLGNDHQRLVVIQGNGPLATALTVQLSPLVHVTTSGDRDDHETAALANDLHASLLFAVVETPSNGGLELTYFASYRSRSVVGLQLANSIAAAIRATSPLDVVVRGMALPILRETLMPAMVITTELGAGEYTGAVVAAINRATVALFDNSR
jgi:peptidoglycan hydrolase-like protein with peptidoglycan-binding domain